MEPLTDLFATLLVLSGLYGSLVLVCDLIERLMALSAARPRRTRGPRSQRRSRNARPRRRREEQDSSPPSVRLAC